jgi:23S rRNA (guanine745-N1)-methyltransferase
VIGDVVHLLACPVCRCDLTAPEAAALRCPNDHAFDVARQGYVNLLTTAPATSGDTAAMVAARARFLAAGHYAPIADVVGDLAVPALSCGERAAVVDVGAGPGWYLARLLDRATDADTGPVGLALDVSVYAARRAARAHRRVGCAVCDTWRSLPVRDGCADVVLDVFAPRNAPELHRVLRPGGVLVVVTPGPAHLEELRAALGLLRVVEGKEERLARSLGGLFDLVGQERRRLQLCLSREDIGALVAMGPSAWHGASPTDRALDALAEPVAVTAQIRVAAYRRPG